MKSLFASFSSEKEDSFSGVWTLLPIAPSSGSLPALPKDNARPPDKVQPTAARLRGLFCTTGANSGASKLATTRSCATAR